MSYITNAKGRRTTQLTKTKAPAATQEVAMSPKLQRGDEEIVTIDTDPTVFGPGVWFVFSSLAARARTPEAIDNFIGTSIPVMINLLCSTCSRHARTHLAKPTMHPDRYRNIKDHRGELIGMFMWIYDFHNFVNEHVTPRKPHMPLDHALAIYSPVLDLTKGEIDSDFEAAQQPSTMSKLHHVTFVDEDDPDIKPLEPVNAPEANAAVQPIASSIPEQSVKPVANIDLVVPLPRAAVLNPSRPAIPKAKPVVGTRMIKPCTKCGQKFNHQ